MKQSTINTILIVLLMIGNVIGFNYFSSGSSSETNVEKAVTAAIEKLEAEKVGGEENYKLVQKIYTNDAFATQQKQSLENALKQMGQAAEAEKKANAPKVLDKEALSAVTKDITIKGDQDADILLIEYSDIECPFCKRHHTNGTIEEVLKNHDNVKVTFKNFPLNFHKEAQHNAEAIECAKDQADADTVHSFIGGLFEADDITTEGTLQVAKDAGLDTDALQSCIDSGDKTEIVAAQMNEGQSVFGVNGTPGNVLLNTKTGKYAVLAGAVPYSQFKAEIKKLSE